MSKDPQKKEGKKDKQNKPKQESAYKRADSTIAPINPFAKKKK